MRIKDCENIVDTIFLSVANFIANSIDTDFVKRHIF